MSRYIYVEEKDYHNVLSELNSIINNLHYILRSWRVCTFQEVLIGSGKQGLITFDTKGNNGFDFDYNLVIQSIDDYFLDDDGRYTAKDLKLVIMDALDEALKNTNYKPAQNSSSVITIKVIDTKNSKIKYGADFAIIIDGEKIKYNKREDRYVFEKLPSKRSNEYGLLEQFKKDNLWNEFRELYLYKKNAQTNKKSSSLRRETTNEIFMKYYD